MLHGPETVHILCSWATGKQRRFDGLPLSANVSRQHAVANDMTSGGKICRVLPFAVCPLDLQL
jgi:hypothetical protein